VLLSTLVVGGIGYVTFDLKAFREMAQRTEVVILCAALLVTAGRVAAGGWRLSFVSQGRLRPSSGVRGQLAWDFFSNVTPSAIGGGPVTALYIARDRAITVGEATAFMMFAMLLDQIWFLIALPLLFAASLILPVIPASVGSVGLWSVLAYFGVLACWAGLFAYTMLVRPHLLERLADRLFRWRYLRRFRSRVLQEMRTFAERAEHLRAQPVLFYVKGVGITALTWAGRYVLVFLVVRSVYAEADALLMILRTAAMTLLGLILPTPGGSGGIEGLYALFIGPLMPSALVAPTLLTWRLLSYYLFIALGAYLFLHHVRRRADAAASAGVASPSPQDSAPPPSESAPSSAPALKEVDP
jgi:uncharacterized protein (TIRG00374 family)